MAKTVVGLFDGTTNIDSVAADLERIGIPKRHIHPLRRADAGRGEGAKRSWTDRLSAYFGFTGDEEARETGARYADAMDDTDVLMVVDVDDAMVDRTTAIMNQYGALDLAARVRARAVREPAAASVATAMPKATPAPESRPIATGASTTIPVVEEELEIGKRIVQSGGVRVHSYVEEIPVAEIVRLREEHVDVARRPADRPATAADVFQEGTIEVPATAERPVVAKQARVVEEVVIDKTAEVREEVVEDTVRRKDVDVEPLPKTGTGGR